MQVFSDLERSVCRMVHRQVSGSLIVIDFLIIEDLHHLDLTYESCSILFFLCLHLTGFLFLPICCFSSFMFCFCFGEDIALGIVSGVEK